MLFGLAMGLVVTFLGDMLQFSTRTTASIMRISDVSTHLVSVSMLINRVGAATTLVIIGFLLDTGTSIKYLVSAYIAFLVMIALFYALYSIYFSKLIALEAWAIRRFYSLPSTTPRLCNMQIARINIQDYIEPRYLDIAFSYCLSILGFILPSIVASMYPDYRATLLQTGFILNSFSTIYFTLICEKRFANVLINGSTNEKLVFSKQFMALRGLGSLLTIAFLIVIARLV
jgi:hypothetical protein